MSTTTRIISKSISPSFPLLAELRMGEFVAWQDASRTGLTGLEQQVRPAVTTAVGYVSGGSGLGARLAHGLNRLFQKLRAAYGASVRTVMNRRREQTPGGGGDGPDAGDLDIEYTLKLRQDNPADNFFMATGRRLRRIDQALRETVGYGLRDIVVATCVGIAVYRSYHDSWLCEVTRVQLPQEPMQDLATLSPFVQTSPLDPAFLNAQIAFTFGAIVAAQPDLNHFVVVSPSRLEILEDKLLKALGRTYKISPTAPASVDFSYDERILHSPFVNKEILQALVFAHAHPCLKDAHRDTVVPKTLHIAIIADPSMITPDALAWAFDQGVTLYIITIPTRNCYWTCGNIGQVVNPTFDPAVVVYTGTTARSRSLATVELFTSGKILGRSFISRWLSSQTSMLGQADALDVLCVQGGGYGVDSPATFLGHFVSGVFWPISPAHFSANSQVSVGGLTQDATPQTILHKARQVVAALPISKIVGAESVISAEHLARVVRLLGVTNLNLGAPKHVYGWEYALGCAIRAAVVAFTGMYWFDALCEPGDVDALTKSLVVGVVVGSMFNYYYYCMAVKASSLNVFSRYDHCSGRAWFNFPRSVALPIGAMALIDGYSALGLFLVLTRGPLTSFTNGYFLDGCDEFAAQYTFETCPAPQATHYVQGLPVAGAHYIHRGTGTDRVEGGRDTRAVSSVSPLWSRALDLVGGLLSGATKLLGSLASSALLLVGTYCTVTSKIASSPLTEREAGLEVIEDFIDRSHCLGPLSCTSRFYTNTSVTKGQKLLRCSVTAVCSGVKCVVSKVGWRPDVLTKTQVHVLSNNNPMGPSAANAPASASRITGSPVATGYLLRYCASTGARTAAGVLEAHRFAALNPLRLSFRHIHYQSAIVKFLSGANAVQKAKVLGVVANTRSGVLNAISTAFGKCEILSVGKNTRVISNASYVSDLPTKHLANALGAALVANPKRRLTSGLTQQQIGELVFEAVSGPPRAVVELELACGDDGSAHFWATSEGLWHVSINLGKTRQAGRTAESTLSTVSASSFVSNTYICGQIDGVGTLMAVPIIPNLILRSLVATTELTFREYAFAVMPALQAYQCQFGFIPAVVDFFKVLYDKFELVATPIDMGNVAKKQAFDRLMKMWRFRGDLEDSKTAANSNTEDSFFECYGMTVAEASSIVMEQTEVLKASEVVVELGDVAFQVIVTTRMRDWYCKYSDEQPEGRMMVTESLLYECDKRSTGCKYAIGPQVPYGLINNCAKAYGKGVVSEDIELRCFVAGLATLLPGVSAAVAPELTLSAPPGALWQTLRVRDHVCLQSGKVLYWGSGCLPYLPVTRVVYKSELFLPGELLITVYQGQLLWAYYAEVGGDLTICESLEYPAVELAEGVHEHLQEMTDAFYRIARRAYNKFVGVLPEKVPFISVGPHDTTGLLDAGFFTPEGAIAEPTGAQWPNGSPSNWEFNSGDIQSSWTPSGVVIASRNNGNYIGGGELLGVASAMAKAVPKKWVDGYVVLDVDCGSFDGSYDLECVKRDIVGLTQAGLFDSSDYTPLNEESPDNIKMYKKESTRIFSVANKLAKEFQTNADGLRHYFWNIFNSRWHSEHLEVPAQAMGYMPSGTCWTSYLNGYNTLVELAWVYQGLAGLVGASTYKSTGDPEEPLMADILEPERKEDVVGHVAGTGVTSTFAPLGAIDATHQVEAAAGDLVHEIEPIQRRVVPRYTVFGVDGEREIAVDWKEIKAPILPLDQIAMALFRDVTCRVWYSHPLDICFDRTPGYWYPGKKVLQEGYVASDCLSDQELDLLPDDRFNAIPILKPVPGVKPDSSFQFSFSANSLELHTQYGFWVGFEFGGRPWQLYQETPDFEEVCHPLWPSVVKVTPTSLLANRSCRMTQQDFDNWCRYCDTAFELVLNSKTVSPSEFFVFDVDEGVMNFANSHREYCNYPASGVCLVVRLPPFVFSGWPKRKVFAPRFKPLA